LDFERLIAHQNASACAPGRSTTTQVRNFPSSALSSSIPSQTLSNPCKHENGISFCPSLARREWWRPPYLCAGGPRGLRGPKPTGMNTTALSAINHQGKSDPRLGSSGKIHHGVVIFQCLLTFMVLTRPSLPHRPTRFPRALPLGGAPAGGSTPAYPSRASSAPSTAARDAREQPGQLFMLSKTFPTCSHSAPHTFGTSSIFHCTALGSYARTRPRT
jgi:hypothetical protein